MNEDLLTAAQVADLAGVARGAVANWVKQGRLKPTVDRPRGKYRFRLFRLEDAQPLIEDAKKRASESATGNA